MTTFYKTHNESWSNEIIDLLSLYNVRYICFSPGSRSTPLILAAKNRSTLTMFCHIDERAMAFHALGYARATLEPVAIITTSGTAVANLFPAIIEASQSHLPLIVITADRPPELINVGANQAIDQHGIFGTFVRGALTLPCPGSQQDAGKDKTDILTLFSHLSGKDPGPVHLNCPFREPLIPIGDKACIKVDGDYDYSKLKVSMRTDVIVDTAICKQLVDAYISGANGIIVIGEVLDIEDAKAIHEWVKKMGWPVIADTLSQLHFMSVHPYIPYYDLGLSCGLFDEVDIDIVIQIGGHLTSKRLLECLAKQAPKQYVQVAPHNRTEDPIRKVTHRLTSAIKPWVMAVMTELDRTDTHTPYQSPLFQRVKGIQAKVDHYFQATKEDHELAMIRAISKQLPADHALFISNSLPIRLIEAMSCHDDILRHVAANRGASGIDGIVSSAIGFAIGGEKPVTVLIGDLAAIHDMNGWLQVKAVSTPMVIIIINNNGGNIFSFLPIATHDEFDQYFKTPQNISFNKIAEMIDIPYETVKTVTQLQRAYSDANHNGGVTMIEVITSGAKTAYDELVASLQEDKASVYSPSNRDKMTIVNT